MMLNNVLITIVVLSMISMIFKSGRAIGFEEGQKSVTDAIRLITAISKKDEKLPEEIKES